MGVTRRFHLHGFAHPHPTLPHQGGGLKKNRPHIAAAARFAASTRSPIALP
ncbi:hypothetical protein J2728_000332 [Caulobacter segnis]|nr:hypothetical protein [Caulobacter segnis]